MAMLSELLGFDVTDAGGKMVRPVDFGIALLEDDYPPVTSLYFRSASGIDRLNLDSNVRIDRRRRRIEVPDLAAAEPSDADKGTGEVLLRRDVLDALIVDLLNRTTTRATDLLLTADDSTLRLKAVDVGLRAMLRQISRGLFTGIRRSDMCDWRYVEFLRGDPHAVDSGAGYRLRIGRLPAGEIAQIAIFLPYLHTAELLTLLPDEKAARALQALPLERQLQVVEEFDDDETADLLARMSPDKAADLIGLLTLETAKRYLSLLPTKKREMILGLLKYPADMVGGIMTNNIVTFTEGTSVKTACDRLRKHAREHDFITVIFVSESSGKGVFSGSLTIRELLDADDEKKLKDVVNPYVSTLGEFEPALHASHKVIGSQVTAMPVTDADGCLVGAVTIDTAIARRAAEGSDLRELTIFA